MRSALLWLLIVFVAAFHVLTLAYSPLPRIAEVWFASQVFGHLDVSHLGQVKLPSVDFAPVYFKIVRYVQGPEISLFRSRLPALVFGLAVPVLVFLIARLSGMRKLYADILLLALCFEPGFALLLHNGQPDTTALFFLLLGFLVLVRRALPGFGHYLLSGSLFGVATLTIPPLAYLTLATMGWLIFRAIRREGWMPRLGALIFGFGWLLVVGYFIRSHNYTFSAWYQSVKAWELPILNYTQKGATQHEWWYVYPWHYFILGAAVVITILYIVRAGFKLPHVQGLALLLAISYLLFIQPKTGNAAFALPLLYLVLVYMADYIGQQIGWYAARPLVLVVVGNNLAFSVGAVFFVMTSLGGRDYAMADYELGRHINEGDVVAADARYYFSIAKHGGIHQLVKARQLAHPDSINHLDQETDFVLMHETEQLTKPADWRAILNRYDTVPVTRLRSYINAPFFKRENYGWLAQKSQDWQMNYDGVLIRAVTAVRNKRKR